jgi:hypothetical protein
VVSRIDHHGATDKDPRIIMSNAVEYVSTLRVIAARRKTDTYPGPQHTLNRSDRPWRNFAPRRQQRSIQIDGD